MERKTAVILATAILTATSLAYAHAKKKPHVSAAIMGSLGAFGLIYTLMKEAQQP